jgi:hypothetical protein
MEEAALIQAAMQASLLEQVSAEQVSAQAALVEDVKRRGSNPVSGTPARVELRQHDVGSTVPTTAEEELALTEVAMQASLDTALTERLDQQTELVEDLIHHNSSHSNTEPSESAACAALPEEELIERSHHLGPPPLPPPMESPPCSPKMPSTAEEEAAQIEAAIKASLQPDQVIAALEKTDLLEEAEAHQHGSNPLKRELSDEGSDALEKTNQMQEAEARPTSQEDEAS